MNNYIKFLFSIVTSATLVGCGGGGGGSSTTVTETGGTSSEVVVNLFNLPANASNYSIFPPRIPSDNPITAEKIELGKYLFYDEKLSYNQTQACYSCHLQENAFSDHNTVGIGSTGVHGLRNPNSLTNTGYYTSYSWANPSLGTLESFIERPITNDDPIELGVDTNEKMNEVLARFSSNTKYQELFTKAFPNIQNPYTLENMVKALASFSRTLNSFNSLFDKYQRGDKTAMSESAIRGMNIFNGERGECFHCHDGASSSFSDSTADEKSFTSTQFFHNIGLYNINGDGSYPEFNQGLYEVTQIASDKGRFKTPSLRNVELTAPYMHDGSMATLAEIIDLHSNGGRNVTTGANIGDGRNHPYLDENIAPRNFTEQEKADLIEFLKSLTDNEFITNPKLANPFEQGK